MSAKKPKIYISLEIRGGELPNLAHKLGALTWKLTTIKKGDLVPGTQLKVRANGNNIRSPEIESFDFGDLVLGLNETLTCLEDVLLKISRTNLDVRLCFVSAGGESSPSIVLTPSILGLISRLNLDLHVDFF